MERLGVPGPTRPRLALQTAARLTGFYAWTEMGLAFHGSATPARS